MVHRDTEEARHTALSKLGDALNRTLWRVLVSDRGKVLTMANEPQLNGGSVEGQAWPLCSDCLEPCNPMQDYCENCGSNNPVNPLIAYMPFANIRFNVGLIGKLWHKICHDDSIGLFVKCFYLAVIFMFSPIALVLFLVSLWSRDDDSSCHQVTENE